MKIKLCRVINHQHKADAYIQALANAGYEFTERDNVQGVMFYLVDGDWRTPMMENAHSRNIPVFLYPHAARPMVIYDGCVEPQPVRAMFTQAPGGKQLMEKIAYPYPVEVTGWAYSEIRPFHPVTEVKRILFAPIHPNGTGYLNRIDKDLTYFRLNQYCRETGAELSIRVIGNPKDSGLGDVPPELIHRGKKNNSTADMLTADVVAAHQTFAYMAVALGIPTVMIGEDIPPRSGNSEAGFSYVKHWDEYKELLMFPLDLLNGEPAEIIAKAAAGSPEVEDWKTRLIGKSFDGPAFVRTLESYL